MMILPGNFQYPGSFSRIYIGNWRPTVFCLRFVTFRKHTSATKWRVCHYFHLSWQASPVLFQSLLLKRNWKLRTYSKRRALTPRVFLSIFCRNLSRKVHCVASTMCAGSERHVHWVASTMCAGSERHVHCVASTMCAGSERHLHCVASTMRAFSKWHFHCLASNMCARNKNVSMPHLCSLLIYTPSSGRQRPRRNRCVYRINCA